MKKIVKSILVSSLLVLNGVSYAQEVENLTEPTKAVYELIQKHPKYND